MIMFDTITTLGNSLIQHGPFNQRIYLQKLSEQDFPEIIGNLDALATEKGYTKIFAKIPAYAKESFLHNNYEIEATIPEFYSGQQPVYFMGKYFSSTRKRIPNEDEIKKVLLTAQAKQEHKPVQIITPKNMNYRKCAETDCQQMAALYQAVFTTYPFPIQDPAYIRKTMKDNITYWGVWHHERLIAVASAETDYQAGNTEMTDFATLSAFRGENLSSLLLYALENYIRDAGIKTAYTIARSISYGMNITFAKKGYTYCGTLPNNTNISGGLESMNVWYKQL